MKILHVAVNPDWYADGFNFLFAQLGHTSEIQHICGYDMTVDKANARWAEYREYYDSFDAIFVSHLATHSRTFLQNGWKKPLYIWFDFRFDHGPTDPLVFHELIRETRLKPNVKFFAAFEYNKRHTQRILKDFPVEVISPLIYVNNENKIKIPYNENAFFIINKHNETRFMNLKEKLNALAIPSYEIWGWDRGAPDLRGVKGIIHVPYTYETRCLRENLALENVYFLPSLDFFESLRVRPNFFWEIYDPPPNDVGFSEWYKKENEGLFVYFSSFEALKEIVESPSLSELVADRKSNIRAFNQRRNADTFKKWEEVFNGDKS